MNILLRQPIFVASGALIVEHCISDVIAKRMRRFVGSRCTNAMLEL